MNAAAWFYGASFHGSSAHAPDRTASPDLAPVVDSRPRRDYMLASGELITYIADHGDPIRPTITYALKGGRVVLAMLSPIRRVDIEALQAYAARHGDQRLRYLAADALGQARPGADPLTGAERCAAIRSCADELQLMRAMGTEIGGGS